MLTARNTSGCLRADRPLLHSGKKRAVGYPAHAARPTQSPATNGKSCIATVGSGEAFLARRSLASAALAARQSSQRHRWFL